jgi:hypothetical protein
MAQCPGSVRVDFRLLSVCLAAWSGATTTGRTLIKLSLGIFTGSSQHVVTLVESALNRCTVQPFTESDDARCWVNAIFPPEDGHVNARNMSRIIV